MWPNSCTAGQASKVLTMEKYTVDFSSIHIFYKHILNDMAISQPFFLIHRPIILENCVCKMSSRENPRNDSKISQYV